MFPAILDAALPSKFNPPLKVSVRPVLPPKVTRPRLRKFTFSTNEDPVFVMLIVVLVPSVVMKSFRVTTS